MAVIREGRTSATESKYSSAVVKSGKLYVVQCYVYRQLRAARPMSGGKQLHRTGNSTGR